MKLSQKPSGIWRVDFRDPVTGARRRESTRTRDRKLAYQIAVKMAAGLDPFTDAATGDTVAPGSATAQVLEAAASEARPQITAATATVADLFRHCQLTVWNPKKLRSQATLRSNLKVLEPLIGHFRVRDLDESRLADLVHTLEAKGYAPATVKRKLDCVGKAMTAALTWRIGDDIVLYRRPQFPKVKQQKNQRRNLTDAEEQALFAMIDRRVQQQPTMDWPRFRMLFRFLLDTGMRLGETLKAEVDWFRPVGDRWAVFIPGHVTKSGKPRTIPLTPAVASMLPALRLASVNGRVFPFREATVWKRFDSLRLDVKENTAENIDDVVIHSLRHTCLTRLARKYPIQLVAKWAGHTNIQITISYYVHLTTDDLETMVGQLETGLDAFDYSVPVNAMIA